MDLLIIMAMKSAIPRKESRVLAALAGRLSSSDTKACRGV
jgi:hypothetical protein